MQSCKRGRCLHLRIESNISTTGKKRPCPPLCNKDFHRNCNKVTSELNLLHDFSSEGSRSSTQRHRFAQSGAWEKTATIGRPHFERTAWHSTCCLCVLLLQRPYPQAATRMNRRQHKPNLRGGDQKPEELQRKKSVSVHPSLQLAV